MHLRLINYTAGWGGVPRFVVELLKALKQSRPDVRIEFISHGECLHKYRGLFRLHGLEIQSQDITPLGHWRTAPGRIFGIRGTGRLMQALTASVTKWGFEIPRSALDDCDAALLPCLFAHRIPENGTRPTIATLHDTIALESDAELLDSVKVRERSLVTRAFASNVQIVTSSQTTATRVAEVFQVDARRIRVVALSGDHDRRGLAPFTPNGCQWLRAPFIFCPAHISPHKNHRALFEATAQMSQRYPVVLTGIGTDLPRFIPRALRLRGLAQSKGLQIGKDIIGLGYVTDQLYYAILQNAWATVMPTLAEGGGSFPVEEAVLQGVPVVCSDIPVMHEHMQRLGAEVLWFDPHDPADLAAKLVQLRRNYAFYKQRAQEQVARISPRSWRDVAADYWRIIDEAVGV